MDPITTIALVSRVVGITELTLQISSDLYQYLRKVEKVPKLSRELHQEVLAISDALVNIGLALKTDPLKLESEVQINETLGGIESTLNEIARRTHIGKESIFRRLEWPFSQKENADCLSKLKGCNRTISFALFRDVRFYPYNDEPH